MATVRDPQATRRRILSAARDEFYHHGYRAGSLNEIVAAAGVTKGALFHHFPGKRALVLALIDEVLAPEIGERWIVPLAATELPLDELSRVFTDELARIDEEGSGGFLSHGCPLANLAADAAADDEPVRLRLEFHYREWRTAVAAALERGRRAGSVHPNVAAADEAAFLVAAWAGIATTGKVSRDLALLRSAFRAAGAYLETLRAPTA